VKSLSIKALLAILAAVTLAGFATILLLFTLSTQRTTRTFEDIINVDEALLGQLQEMYAQGLQTGQATRNVLLNPTDKKAKENYDTADGKFRKAAQAALALAKGPAQEKLRALGPLWEEDHALKNEIMNLALGGKAQDAVDVLNAKETKKWREVKALVQQLIEEQATKSKTAYAQYTSHEAKTFWATLATMGIMLALVSVLLLSAWRMILRPLEAICAFARSQAAGRFSECLKGHFQGEFREVSEALCAMSDTVQRSLGFTQGVLKGIASPFLVVTVDNTVRMTNQALLDILQFDGTPEGVVGMDGSILFYGKTGHKGVVVQAMEEKRAISIEREMIGRKGGKRNVLITASPLYNNITGELMGGLDLFTDMTELREKEAHIMAQNVAVTDAAKEAEGVLGSLLGCSERLARHIREAEDGAAQQRERAGEATQVMGDMSESIMGAAESATAAAEGAEHAGSEARQGQDVVRQVMQAVEEVRQQTLSLKENMGELGRQAESIGQVMNVISDIADQTNLLALNAAIEAARAGDAGRGFAVVADEVRKLAEKTMTATREVGEAIGNIQRGTRANVAQVETAAHNIERTTSLAGGSGEALVRIVDMVQETTQRVRGIAKAVELQSTASGRVDASVEEINDIALRTATGMDVATRDVDELRDLTERLRGIVDGMVGQRD